MFFVLLLLGVFGVKRAVSLLKEKMIFPRSGEVHYEELSDRGSWRLILAIAFVAVLGLILPEQWSQIPLTVGVIMMLILIYMGYQVGLRLLQIAALVPLAAAILAVALEWGDVLGTISVFVGSGFVLILMGIFAFRHFLSENPKNAEGQ